jgi:Right handed beta helix region
VACTGCATGFSTTPTAIGTDDASFPGKVVSDAGGQVEYWAQYGPTTSYGSETPHQTITVAKNALAGVTVRISGVQRATVYHYRLCAQDSQQQGGPGCSADQHFTTQTYGCGETVTTSFKLTGNLECPQEPGFVVGADGIDINLAGHSMEGEIASGGGGPTGIDNTAGHDDVTIRNGTIGTFGTGIQTQGASRNHILNITSQTANTPVVIQGGDANEVRHGDLFGRSRGLSGVGTAGLVVADSSLVGIFSDGLDVTGDSPRIVRDRLVRLDGGIPIALGIRVNSNNARIADNHVEGGWSAGGIVVSGANNVLVGNEALSITHVGVPDEPPEFGDGIFVGPFSAGVVLRGNRADGNGSDGIDVRASATQLEGNAAFSNGGWGILAVSGVTDLGGNTAGGNGAGQCQNVFCP